jgi:hypothetical protein
VLDDEKDGTNCRVNSSGLVMKIITYEEACRLALSTGLEIWGNYISVGLKPTLEHLFIPKVIRGSYCWIFIMNAAIDVPESDWFAKDTAIAISFIGEVRRVADHHRDEMKLANYAEKLSDHFIELHKL